VTTIGNRRTHEGSIIGKSGPEVLIEEKANQIWMIGEKKGAT